MGLRPQLFGIQIQIRHLLVMLKVPTCPLAISPTVSLTLQVQVPYLRLRVRMLVVVKMPPHLSL